MKYPQVILKRGEHLRILNGHPWIYGNEIEKLKSEDGSEVQGGSVVEVLNAKEKFIGRGYYNPQSQIAVRLPTRNPKQEINEDFFRKRILTCYEFRKKTGCSENFR